MPLFIYCSVCVLGKDSINKYMCEIFHFRNKNGFTVVVRIFTLSRYTKYNGSRIRERDNLIKTKTTLKRKYFLVQ